MGDLISRKALLNKLKNSFISINYHPDFGDIAEGMASELYNEALADTIKMIEEQPTAIDGVLRDTKETYRRTVKVKPTEHHYEEPGEEPYIKYICPVCEALGRRHQVNPVVQNCPVCGVQLYWGEFEPAVKSE